MNIHAVKTIINVGSVIIFISRSKTPSYFILDVVCMTFELPIWLLLSLLFYCFQWKTIGTIALLFRFWLNSEILTFWWNVEASESFEKHSKFQKVLLL